MVKPLSGEMCGDRLRNLATHGLGQEQPLAGRVEVNEHESVAGVDPVLTGVAEMQRARESHGVGFDDRLHINPKA